MENQYGKYLPDFLGWPDLDHPQALKRAPRPRGEHHAPRSWKVTAPAPAGKKKVGVNRISIDIYRYIIEYLWYIYIYHILLIVYIKSNEQRNEQIKVPTLLVSITVLIIINDMISDFV